MVYRWRLVLEEYGPEIRYIKGEKNIAADALSRLPLQDDVKEELFNDFSEDLSPDACPLSYRIIEKEQGKDKELGKRLVNTIEGKPARLYAIVRKLPYRVL